MFKAWLLVFVFGISNYCRAEFITYNASLPAQNFSLGSQVGGNVANGFLSTLNWNGSLGIDFFFPKFDSSLGTLNDVLFGFSGASGLTADVLFVNNRLPPFDIAGITFSMTTNVTLRDATASITNFDSNTVANSVTAFSNVSFNFVVGSDTFNAPLLSVPGANHASYIGSGQVTLPMTVQFLADATTSNGAFLVTPFPVLALSNVQLTYDYTPVPEPALTLFGLGLLATIARKRFRKST